MKITALAGGVGAAKLLTGLVAVAPEADLTVIVNTGDDFRWHGLLICPDIDTVIHSLAGIANPESGWGIRGDTFHCLESLSRLGGEDWFRIGDRDLATHVYRTDLLARGSTLTAITAELSRRHGIPARILPMTDQPVPTFLETDEGLLAFQDYFVKRKCAPQVRGVRYLGAEESVPAPGALEALAAADLILICPSNPFISIGPILAVPGIRPALQATAAPVVGVSPIIAGKAIKGPAADMLRRMGHEVSAAGVARHYADILTTFVVDVGDEDLLPGIAALGIEARSAPIIMCGREEREAAARAILDMVP